MDCGTNRRTQLLRTSSLKPMCMPQSSMMFFPPIETRMQLFPTSVHTSERAAVLRWKGELRSNTRKFGPSKPCPAPSGTIRMGWLMTGSFGLSFGFDRTQPGRSRIEDQRSGRSIYAGIHDSIPASDSFLTHARMMTFQLASRAASL